MSAPLPLTTEAALATPPHYDRIQRSFHWVMAAIVLAALLIGLYCSFQAPGTPVRRWLLEWHKSLGLTALALIGFRIAYRLTIRTPPYAEAMSRLTHGAAQSAHLILYGLMLAMPISGYVTSGAGGHSLPWFGLFQWPRVVPLDKGLERLGATVHQTAAYVLYAVVALHILAVLWHRFVRRDDVLARMWPTRSVPPQP